MLKLLGMKKIKKYIAIFLCLIVCVFLLKNVVLWQGVYLNSPSLTAQENKQVKAVILSAIKDRCSSLYKLKADDIYDAEHADKIIQYDKEAQASKGVCCLIDFTFMTTATKIADGRYQVEVKVYYPEAYYYHFEVRVIDGRYLITSFQLDI